MSTNRWTAPWRAIGIVGVVVLLGACGNSDDDDAEAAADTTASTAADTAATEPADDAATTTTAASDETTPATDAEAPDERDVFVPLEGVPGVSDDAISYTAIGTRSNNPLGTCILDCYVDGIEAYFAYRNSEGGIYGRDLVLGNVLDDELSQNQVRALEVVSADDAFGSFNATQIASGWADLADAGIPTYTWGIHVAEAMGRPAIFPSAAQGCVDCTSRLVPFAASLAGATRVASIGYGTTENSKRCTTGTAASFDRYPEASDAEVVYVNDELEFGLGNGIGPQVTAMREAGVDFIATCIDLNGMLTLAQELERQGMQDVVLYHPNTYDQRFVQEAGELFEGDYVSVAFRPFEADPGDSQLGAYLEWMEHEGNELTELAMVGWINADLAFQGLLAAGPEFDRQAVIDATNAMTAYSAGGLINPIDWTRQHDPTTEDDRSNGYAQECTALVHIVGGAFETVEPAATPWACWPGNDLVWSEPVPTNFE